MVLELWLTVIVALISLAAIFWFLGWRWESKLIRPRARNYNPFVSIIIPAYNSEKTIGETIRSAKAVSYKKKEIIVVNDSRDKTPQICMKLGVKVIQNKKRLGKCIALNNAARKARGDILFFLDADTTIDSDTVSKVVPWFTKKDVAIVSPKYLAQESKKLLPKLASIENKFNSSLFKAHMFFGSMISIRGCGVAIRREFFDKIGGWSKTLIEDVDFAGKTLKSNHKIQYEPEAVVRTKECETIAELKNQRMRWGKGSAYSFLNYKSTYSGNKQFSLHFFPYIFLIFTILGIFAWQLYLFVPLIFLYILYSFSFAHFATIMMVLMIPLFYGIFAVVVTGSLGHLTIITWREKERTQDIILLIPYLFFYIPLVIFFYFRGMISGFSHRRYSKNEFNLKDW